MKKKMFDDVAFMRKRWEGFSRAYGGLAAKQIKERIHRTPLISPAGFWRAA